MAWYGMGVWYGLLAHTHPARSPSTVRSCYSGRQNHARYRIVSWHQMPRWHVGTLHSTGVYFCGH